MFGFIGAKAKRKRLLKTVGPGALKDFLSHSYSQNNELIGHFDLLAVDFETTGLDPRKDEILSIGYVQIQNFEIKLNTATHLLIKSNSPLPEKTVVIHKITDDQIVEGVPLKLALDKFLQALKGKVLVAHYAKVESHFLNQACKQIYNCGIIIPTIDTILIEAKRLPSSQNVGDDLNLSECCKRYNLPRYRLHDALSDALSCAQLLLAQLAYGPNAEKTKANELIKNLP